MLKIFNELFTVAIVGSRSIPVSDATLNAVTETLDGIRIKAVVSGGARGGDKIAEEWARRKGVELIVHLPEWDLYGKAAGMIRNTKIVEDADILIAFWDGHSKGTLDSIKKANRKGIKVTIILVEQ